MGLIKGINSSSYLTNINKMYLVKFLYNTYFYSAVIVPFYTDWGGIKFSQILFLNAWFMAWNFLLEIPTGTVADFLGRKVSLYMGCIIGGLGCLVYASVPNFTVFMLAEIILSFSFTLLSGADEALVYDSLKASDQTQFSKRVFSHLESFKLAGIVLGAVVGSLIGKYLGLRMAMILQAIPLAMAGILAATLKEPELSGEKPSVSFRSYRKLLTDGVRYFWHSKILKLLALDMIIVFAIAWIIIWFYQALLKSAGVDLVYFGIVHAFMSLSQILIINNFIRIEKLLGSKRRLLFLSAFLTGVFFILLGITTAAPLVIAGIILAAGFGLSRGPLFSNYMNKYIPSDKRATILSTTSMLRTFAIVIVNSVSGILADWSIPNTLLILGASAIVFSFFSKIREEDLID